MRHAFRIDRDLIAGRIVTFNNTMSGTYGNFAPAQGRIAMGALGTIVSVFDVTSADAYWMLLSKTKALKSYDKQVIYELYASIVQHEVRGHTRVLCCVILLCDGTIAAYELHVHAHGVCLESSYDITTYATML